MKVEREIAGFSLPFAAGVIAAVHAAGMHHACGSILSSSAVSAAAVCLAVIMHPSTKKRAYARMLILTCAAAFLCGLFTGSAAHLRNISGPDIPGRAAEVLSGMGKVMTDRIMQLPFSDPQTNAIAAALLTGNRSALSNDTAAAFRSSGASHILALSGLHLGIIYIIIRKMLSFAGNSTASLRMRSMMTAVICGIYTGATGAGPSITRAFLFILLGETASMTGRHKSTSGILLSSLAIHLAISPLSARQAGFQLSYAAMAGIAWIYPHLKNFWPASEHSRPPTDSLLKKIWNSAALSLSCQLTTGPIAYFYFGTFPKHFLLTNLVALPLTGLMIPMALLCVTLSSLGACPDFLLRATEFAVSLLRQSLMIISVM